MAEQNKELRQMEQVEGKIADYLYHHPVLSNTQKAKDIVCFAGILIRDPDQSLPKIDVHLTCEHCADYELGMSKLQDEENWVKVLPKEKK